MTKQKQTPEEWFQNALDGLADENLKADVLKAHIQAAAATEQARLTAEAETEQVKVRDGSYAGNLFLLRGFWGAFLLVAVLAVCVTTCSAIDKRQQVDLARINAEHPQPHVPPPPPPPPPPSASSSASPGGSPPKQ